MKKLNNKGFSLVELLAVVAIVAILLGLAIAGVSSTIEKSRKQAYIDNVNIQKQGIEALITAEKLYVYDENTVYYFDYRLSAETEDSLKSPFADWKSAYVAVVARDEKLAYYWTGIDEAGWKIDLRKEVANLKPDDVHLVKNGNVYPGASIGGRDKVVVFKYNEEDEIEEEEQSVSLEVTLDEAKQCFTLRDAPSGYEISGYKIECGTEVAVPSLIDGIPVSIIGENAFRSLGLTKVTLYQGITELKNGAFQDNNISELKLSPSIKKIGPYAFYQNKIVSVQFPEGLERIEEWAFAYNLIEEVYLPKTLTYLGSYAFYHNRLKYLELNSNPTIEGGAFSSNQMSGTQGIIYKFDPATGKKDYTTIVGYAGESKDVIIPEKMEGVSVKTISSSAFASNGITSVVLPPSIETIGYAAFYNNKLKTVTLPAGLKTIGKEAFRANYLSTISIPNSVTSIGAGAFIYNCFPAGSDLIYGKTASGFDYTTIVSGAGGRVDAANGCSGNKAINIPAVKEGKKLKKIIADAFIDGGYTSLKLPNLSETDGLTIERNAFRLNNFGTGNAWQYKIEGGVEDKSVLMTYTGPRNNGKRLVIPGSKDGVQLKTIQATITWQQYEEIEIPSSVTSISSGIFTKTNRSNTKLVKIINKTGREFNWYTITGSSHENPGAFKTGTVSHQSGDIEITAS